MICYIFLAIALITAIRVSHSNSLQLLAFFYFKELFMLWNTEHQNNYRKVNITSIAEDLDEII